MISHLYYFHYQMIIQINTQDYISFYTDNLIFQLPFTILLKYNKKRLGSMATPFRTPPSCKSKQTTITLQNTNANLYTDNNSYIDISSTKALKKLSMSFYGEQTIKNNKKIIFENYDIFTEAGNLDLIGMDIIPKEFEHSFNKNQRITEKRKVATSIPRAPNISQSKKKTNIRELAIGNMKTNEKDFQKLYLKDLMKPIHFNQTNKIMYKKDRKSLNKKIRKSTDKNISKSRQKVEQVDMFQKWFHLVALGLKKQGRCNSTIKKTKAIETKKRQK